MIRLLLAGLLLAHALILLVEAREPAPIPTNAEAVALGLVPIPEPTEAAVRYHRTGLALWAVARVWSWGVPAVFLLAGWSGRLGRWPRIADRPLPVRVALFAAAYLGFEFLARLPLRYYAGFVRPHEYGLSTETLPHWLGAMLKGLGVEVAGVALFGWVPYALMRRSPRRWWLWTGLLVLPFSLGSAFVVPVLIDPLYHQFGPMRDRPLEARIRALAGRAGAGDAAIYEVDKSRETRTVNAYVTGLAGTKRIVLWDTTMARLDPDEVLAVVGHEVGHYALDHVLIGVTLASLGTLLGLFAVDRLARGVLARLGPRLGFERLDDVASLSLLLLLVELAVFAASPVSNAASRWMEHEADRFALELTRDNHAAARSFAKMQEDNLAVPTYDLFSRVYRSTHPPIGDRIDFCNRYRPWLEGRPLRYARSIDAPPP